ncbi:MAG: hypothetical protein ACI3ZN_11050, partial [Candidatus Cryptobacteroides sp.]
MKKVLFISLMAFALPFVMSAQQADNEQAAQDINQYGQVVESLPVEANLQDGILVFKNKTENYKMWFDIRVQGDAAVFFGAPDFCAKELDGKE